VTERASEPPALDVVLEPGDTLYLPRGYVHSAEAQGDICAHLTVGVQEHTRHAIVEALADLVADEPALRRSLPLGVDVCDPDDLSTEIAATVDSLIGRLQSVRPHEVARIFEERTRTSSRPAPLDPLSQVEALGRLDAESVIVARRHLHWSVAEHGDVLALVLPGRTLRLPLATREAVGALFETGLPARVGDLPALSAPDALALARDLVRAGAVVPFDN
jgi:ribosomal protein L16 Arg81 hydroxylase